MLSIPHEINQKRLWTTLMELAEIGAASPQCGITRLSLSKEDLEAREYVITLMRDCGLDVRVDAIGNIIGRLQGTNVKATTVLTGSHIDTVPQGGIFDGALGVLGAIEAVRTLIENEVKLTHSIEVVSFTDEEGTRFGSGYIGSKGMAGKLNESVFQLTDEQGVSLKAALRDAGFNPEMYQSAYRDTKEFKAYIELHIEQGKVLEEHGLPVGVVTDIQGPVWLDITLHGSPDHAGATPMYMRKDTGVATAEIILEIEEIAKEFEGVGTVGKLRFEPGGVNIIPGKALFSVDLRHVDKEMRSKMVTRVKETVERVCKKRGMTAETIVKKEVDPITCSSDIIEVIEKACSQIQLKTMRLQCGAGHDSLIMGKVTKMGMIFVRSKNGFSHNPKEWSEQEDCVLGTQALLNTLVLLAQ
ncbi:Zn-dependent hydrolase [Bacillus alkalicellulosilyticus]|uniref:Zn-dependent hydrolase n=1 Tax=Alkalihalobacterium alkalicellulosilyticum TaxID=1912214 RepID=UPI001481EA69|nr:Zn-dependent hydrolase [Bacillus alkalicellulosilyticus]